MKKIFFLIFFSLLQGWGLAQSNDWIDFSRDYYKIFTDADGIFRISYTTLSASGMLVQNLDPREIRILHRGEEIAIHVEGQEDGEFEPQDYIEFVGKRNDGTLDRGLYEEPDLLPNPHYNTHSDSSAYFLTISPGQRGKRMVLKGLISNLQEVKRIRKSEMQVFSEQYALGRVYFPGVRLSIYDRGQGWTSSIITRGSNRIFNFNRLGNILPDGSPNLEISLLGRSDNDHLTTIQVGATPNNLREIGSYTFGGFDTFVVEENLLPTDYSQDGSIVVRVMSQGVNNAVDNVSVNYIQMGYDVEVPLGDFEQEIFEFGEGSQMFTLQNLSSPYVAYDISDWQNPRKQAVNYSNGRLEMVVGEVGSPSKVLVQRTNLVRELKVLERVRFRNLLEIPADYLIISHPILRRPAANYGDPVDAYASYRASPEGGGFDTLTMNVQELYDQFSYGEKSPLGIRKFLEAYHSKFHPEILLLIGRAYGMLNTRRAGGVTYFYRNNPSLFDFQELIPAYGYPYSDNQFVVGLEEGDPLGQSISIGRIPARTSDEVGVYLDKIKEKDALGVTQPWQKNIIHLSGGRSAFELERFFNFLNGFREVAEDIFLGGKVETVRKRSNSSTELINIADQVNDGVSLITFFGHAAPSTTDIDIGFVSVNEMGYRNKGKYPVLLLNGCDAGNAYGDAYTFGEDWIVTPDRGASNFLAHADIGIDVYLRRYSETFYAKAFADSSLIHLNLGRVKIAAEKLLYDRYGTSEVNQSHVNQIIMLGDPAARIFPADKADYALTADDIHLQGVDGVPLNSLSDSLELSIVIRNLGRVDLDTFQLNINRQLPDGSIIPIDTAPVPPVFRLDTIMITLPNSGINSFGDNVFSIELNKGREIEEITYVNNAVNTTFFVPLSGTLNLFPLEFGIVNERQVEIIAQIPGISNEERNLLIQLDTISDFSSAFRKEVRITTENLARWEVDLFQQVAEKDTLTYYWRTRFLEPREGEESNWNTSSFSFIKEGPEGWIQRRMAQFEKNQLTNLSINLPAERWDFQETDLNVDVFTFGAETEDLGVENTQIMLNGVSYILDTFNRFCPDGSLGLMTFQQKTLEPYLPIPLVNIDVLDPRSCGRVPQVIQSIRNVNIVREGQTMLMDFVDGVKEGDYVVIFSVGNVTFDQWPEEAYIKLKELGANEATLRNLQTGDPYILFGKKGMEPGEAVEIVPDRNDETPTSSQILRFETDINGYFPTGRILSPHVGPASDWITFFNKVRADDLMNSEYSQFDIIGVTPEGGEVALVSGIQDEEFDLSAFNPEEYPYLRLRYSMDDLEAPAPSQLSNWQVNYTGVPEGVLIMREKRDRIEMKEGEEEALEFEFVNISKFDFTDSITINYTFQNLDQKTIEQLSKKIPPVKSGEGVEFLINFDSRRKGGKNSLHVFANPRIFPEQLYRNNIMDLPEFFTVIADDLNPVLDVNFDGMYIMDGDIVSPTVLISALVKDENKLTLKQDTLGMELMLKGDCEGCEFEKMNFSNPKVRWFEETESSDFKVEFQPGPLEDGIYTLRINASDASGNPAGEKPYEINFEVINESQITNFYPYPNPFSNSVRFVFTVTGAEVPDEIKIQIMTITGKVVREIFQDELGPVRIGNNLSEYAWNGKDEFGDQLANGVYIYRVMVKINGQFIEHRATSGDKAFKKGYGKMYLLR
ncbi:MAG: C25 family cysteine peptidase [Cyclobacteriaceae bacterium]